jgi:hypothetical protein
MDTQADNDYWNFAEGHKDIFRFYPGRDWWDALSQQEKDAEWSKLCKESERQNEEYVAEEKRCIEVFEKAVAEAICSGARDRVTAIRWLLDAQNALNETTGYACHVLGLPFSYNEEIKAVLMADAG